MTKIIFILVLTCALTLLCFENVSAGFVVDGEPEPTEETTTEPTEPTTESEPLQTCLDRFPAAVPDSELTEWFVLYADQVYLDRTLDVFLQGEDRPQFDSPCWTFSIDSIDGDKVLETTTMGALGTSVSIVTTISGNSLNSGQSVLLSPNTQTPALTVHWRPVLSDGKSYLVQFSCLSEGEFGFQVFSPNPELDDDSIYEIQDFLNDAGFTVDLSDVNTYSAKECTTTSDN